MVETEDDVSILCTNEGNQSHRIQPQGTSITSLQLEQPKSGLDDMAEDPLIPVEGAAALLQLKEVSGRSANATSWRGVAEGLYE